MWGLPPFKIVLWIVFAVIATGSSVPASWVATDKIYAGSIQFYMSTLKKISIVSDTFPKSFQSTPNRAMGYQLMETDAALTFDTFIAATSVSASSLSLTCTIDITMALSRLFIKYLMVDQSLTAFDTYNGVDLALFTKTLYPLSLGSGNRQISAVINFTYWTGQVLNPANSNKILVFVQGITLDKLFLSGSFNVTVRASVLNANEYQITVGTSAKCLVTQFIYSRVIFDQTALQATKSIYVDSQTISVVSGNWGGLAMHLPWSTPTNFLVGLTGIAYTGSMHVNFSLSAASAGSFNFGGFQISYFNYRIRTCPGGNPYYLDTTNLCYDVCDPYYSANTTINTCSACYYTCFSCSSASLATCLSCNPSDLRTLSNGQCLCQAGYYDSGSRVCSACNYSCATCTNSSSCLTCSASNFRAYSSGQCICAKGYYDSSVALCSNCSSSMAGCISCTSSTVCTTCDLTYALVGGSCACASGYTMSAGSCVSCGVLMTGCVGCSSTTACTTCANNWIFDGISCVCQVGYYMDSGVCIACTLGCLDCPSASTCNTCDTANGFVLNGGICECDFGKTLSGSMCKPCTDYLMGCESCASTTVCTVCLNNLLISGQVCVCQGSQTYNPATLLCESCSVSPCCQYGQYLELSACNSCPAAIPGCLACSSSTLCDKCLPEYYFNAGSCTPCFSALRGCLQCSSSSVCTNCDAANNFVLSGSMCYCKVGYYFDTGSSSCVGCGTPLPGCLECSDSSTCYFCDTTLNLALNSSNQCQCPSGNFLSGGACTRCDTPLPGCLECSNSTVCTHCDQLLTLVLDHSSNQCVCSTGFYRDGVCKPCSSALVGCVQCSSNDTCTLCDSTANYVSSGSVCACPTGTFSSVSLVCEACDPLCLTCSGSSTNCQSCAPAKILSGGTCACPTATYSSGSGCPSCNAACSQCSGPAITECSSCASPYTLVGSTCECGSNAFIDASNVCVMCHYSCLTCNGSTANDCQSCEPSLNRTLSTNSCPCDPTYNDVGSAPCQLGSCAQGYSLNSHNNTCIQICGDGTLFGAECDDGNGVSGDGCSANCTIEANYTCIGGSKTSASACSYNQPLQVVLVDTWKNATSNIVYFWFQITPAITALNSLDFVTALSCSLPNTTLQAKYDGSVNLLATAHYTTTIQALPANLTFAPSTSGSFFFATPDSITPFTVDPSNNLAAVYYDDEVYSQVDTAQKLAYAVAAVGYSGFLAGMFVGRFISVEMIGVLQVAFLGLISLQYMQPLFAALTNVGFVNGVNTLYSSQRQTLLVNGDLSSGVPKNAVALQYDAQMAYSLNYSIALLLLPSFVGLVLFVASKIVKDNKKKGQLTQWSWTALCDFGLSAVVFLTYHVVASLLVWIMYGNAQGTIFPFSIVDLLLALVVAVSVFVLFWKRPQHFGDFKKAFKPDRLSQAHYYFVIGARILLACLLVGANGWVYSGFISTIIPVAVIVFLGVRRPYLQNYNNYRAISNAAIEAVILGIYGYFRCSVNYTESFSGSNGILPYVVLGLLLSSIAMNIAVLVYFAVLKYKKEDAKETLLKENEQKQQEENTKFVEDMIKEINKFAPRNRQSTSRMIINGHAFRPENIQLSRVQKQYSSQLSIKSINEKLVQQKKFIVRKNSKAIEESVLYTKKEARQIEEDFDAL